MGQYHLIVNIDRREYLDPHQFGQGLKLMEWSYAGASLGQALAVLLAADNGKGGGDLHVPAGHADAGLVGAWAGTRIVVAGDYGDSGKFLSGETRAETFEDGEQRNLYQQARAKFADISDRVIRLLRDAEGDGHPLWDLNLEDPNADRWTKTGYTANEYHTEWRELERLRAATLANQREDAVAALRSLTTMWKAQEERYAKGPPKTRRRRTPNEPPKAAAPEADAPKQSGMFAVGDTVRTLTALSATDGSTIAAGVVATVTAADSGVYTIRTKGLHRVAEFIMAQLLERVSAKQSA